MWSFSSLMIFIEQAFSPSFLLKVQRAPVLKNTALIG
jgi:hypothetical protein